MTDKELKILNQLEDSQKCNHTFRKTVETSMCGLVDFKEILCCEVCGQWLPMFLGENKWM